MKCIQVKADGSQCGAYAMDGAEHCYLHNPAIPAEQKLEAQTKGGANRGLRVTDALPAIQIRTPEDTVMLLADTVKRVRSGQMDARIGNTIAILSAQLIKAFEVMDITNRIESMERIVLEKRTRS